MAGWQGELFFSDWVDGGDCDDLDPSVYPGAVDTWYDGVDSDCAGDDDYDADGDGYASDDHGGTDVDDTDPSVHTAVADPLERYYWTGSTQYYTVPSGVSTVTVYVVGPDGLARVVVKWLVDVLEICVARDSFYLALWFEHKFHS